MSYKNDFFYIYYASSLVFVNNLFNLHSIKLHMIRFNKVYFQIPDGSEFRVGQFFSPKKSHGRFNLSLSPLPLKMEDHDTLKYTKEHCDANFSIIDVFEKFAFIEESGGAGEFTQGISVLSRMKHRRTAWER